MLQQQSLFDARVPRRIHLDSESWVDYAPGWAREPEHIVGKSLDANTLLPWVKRKMLAGEMVVMPSVDATTLLKPSDSVAEFM